MNVRDQSQGAAPAASGGDPLTCKQRGCDLLAVALLFWPGQTTRMCGVHTITAINLARHMGFELAIAADDGRAL